MIAVAIGAIVGYLQEGNSEDAMGGAMAGGCMAAGCLLRIAMAALGIFLILWLFNALFG